MHFTSGAPGPINPAVRNLKPKCSEAGLTERCRKGCFRQLYSKWSLSDKNKALLATLVFFPIICSVAPKLMELELFLKLTTHDSFCVLGKRKQLKYSKVGPQRTLKSNYLWVQYADSPYP